MEFITSLASMAAALGGVEAIKLILNRHSDSRTARARASAEEFRSLREYNDFLQQQLITKEQQLVEKTSIVRSLNADLLDLTRAKSLVDTELAVKRCEVTDCPRRIPPVKDPIL